MTEVEQSRWQAGQKANTASSCMSPAGRVPFCNKQERISSKLEKDKEGVSINEVREIVKSIVPVHT
jgi:hypothetical protein